jgi:hypothetical protein
MKRDPLEELRTYFTIQNEAITSTTDQLEALREALTLTVPGFQSAFDKQVGVQRLRQASAKTPQAADAPSQVDQLVQTFRDLAGK